MKEISPIVAEEDELANRIKYSFMKKLRSFWTIKFLWCKIHTYQPRRGTVPQVKGYSCESFGLLINLIGGKKIIGKSALRYTSPQITPLKESWTKRCFALKCTHLFKSCNDCWGKWFWGRYTKNHSRTLRIRMKLPVHNDSLNSTADLGLSTWFPTRRCYVGTLPTLVSRHCNNYWRIGT